MSQYPLELLPVDIEPYRRSTTGIEFVHRIDSGVAGPTVMVNALTHGNELCGAHALVWLLESGIVPRHGVLIVSFANVAAYSRFDPSSPTASRFIDEDLNRLWSDKILFGGRQSREIARCRELQPFVAKADFLLDIHSMQADCPALMLCGTAPRGRELAQRIGVPAFVIADSGHQAGPRMRDYRAFADPDATATALLVECGQHWKRDSATVARDTMLRFLYCVGMISASTLQDHLHEPTPLPQRFIEVSGPVTIKSDRFAFVRHFHGLEVVPQGGTVIGHDDGEPLRTPYDNCVLIMPAQRPRPGQTAVRFGRFVQ